MIRSPTLLTSTTSFFHCLSTIIPTPFLFFTFPVYQSLKPEVSNSLAFAPTHFVSCRHIMLIFLLVMVSTTSMDFPVRVPMFHVPNLNLLSLRPLPFPL
ncbi:uncharacterized protein DS421_19g661520 [Arachis hypogaea]|uniref:Uncharacterized protein n=1 Tax=Arachis hypogaea TaxID=3818 RepID=A0A6B9VBY0_ARAHY|nr:uncharacterized protein DS421_19g661520 [Arachis hypogaea]